MCLSLDVGSGWLWEDWGEVARNGKNCPGHFADTEGTVSHGLSFRGKMCLDFSVGMFNRTRQMLDPRDVVRRRLSQLRQMRDQQMKLLDELRKQKFSDFVDAKKKRWASLVMVGLTLTVIVALTEALGGLGYFERRFYDARARQFQYFTPAPSPDVFHMDIDDECYARIGRYPWPRGLMGEFVDEMRLAEAKVVMLDILYDEPEDKKVGFTPGEMQLAKALKEKGNVVLAVSLTMEKQKAEDEINKTILLELIGKLDMESEELFERLKARGLARNIGGESKLKERVTRAFINTRQEAVRARILSMVIEAEAEGRKIPTVEDVREALLPEGSELLVGSPLQLAIDDEYPAVMKAQAMKRHGRLAPIGLPELFVAPAALFPIQPLTDAVKSAGFVDYLKGGDAVVREIPLFVNHKGRMFPHTGLAAALAYLDVKLEDLTFTPTSVIIPLKDGKQTVIPVRTVQDAVAGRVPFIMSVPWFGGNDPNTMYDYPNHKKVVQRDSMISVYNVRESKRKLDTNYRELWVLYDKVLAMASGLPRQFDQSLDPVLINSTPEKELVPGAKQRYFGYRDARYFSDNPDKPDKRDDLLPFGKSVLQRRVLTPLIAALEAKLAEEEKLKSDSAQATATIPDSATLPANESADLQPAAQKPEAPYSVTSKRDPTLLPQTTAEKLAFAKQVVKQVEAFEGEIGRLKLQLPQERERLRKQISGKAVFVGLTATGNVDIYPTPIYPTAPGVIVHGAVFNGIVTNHFWTTMPWWVTTLLTLALGGVVTLVVATFSPVPASILALITVAGYALFNGLFLFDYMDLIVGMAGPFFVMATIWAAITVIKYFLEIAERERITRRFRSYVDPQLVNYIEEHPEQSSLTGQIKEMTVVFTDLEGFTTLSERLKEKTVPMLSAYMGEMVPIIRANRGYVNKFLGDGIMFFYNSPLPNDAHAFDAVKTILQMKTAMIGFNQGLLKQNLPTLRMRAGMTTGEMVVGDAGPADGSDYTVLGDTVNLSARLEGANKVVGTDVLMVKRTVELLAGKIAFRPVARIQVKGKEEAVETYEPICLAGEETEEQKKIIAHSKRVYDAYVAGEFAECKKAAEAMIAELGEGKFAKLYLGIAKEYLETGKPQGFDGRIALDSK